MFESIDITHAENLDMEMYVAEDRLAEDIQEQRDQETAAELHIRNQQNQDSEFFDGVRSQYGQDNEKENAQRSAVLRGGIRQEQAQQMAQQQRLREINRQENTRADEITQAHFRTGAEEQMEHEQFIANDISRQRRRQAAYEEEEEAIEAQWRQFISGIQNNE
jgi:hypothetical protein